MHPTRGKFRLAFADFVISQTLHSAPVYPGRHLDHRIGRVGEIAECRVCAALKALLGRLLE
jgi:hypothetical protein